MTERFVVLGLAGARASWFRSVARWSTEAVLPIEFVKCLTIDEVRSRLRSGRVHSALLLDGQVRGIDRDLLEHASDTGCAVVMVDPNESRWDQLGAKATLRPDFGSDELFDVLTAHSTPVSSFVPVTETGAADPVATGEGWQGKFVAVTGSPGSGTSTVASLLAQGMADDARHGALVALADLARRADQAMMHDIDDIVPGISEVVEAHRNGVARNAAMRSNLFTIAERRYDLLLGLRRERDWAALRPRATKAALESLRNAYRVVVADVDCDVEDEATCGSVEVEERNLLGRTSFGMADLIVVVGQPSLWGLHGLARCLDGLENAGFGSGRTLPVINHAPRRRRERAELARTLHELVGASRPELPSPVFVDRRARIERVTQAGGRLPDALSRTIAGATSALLSSLDPVAVEEMPRPVLRGELGSWADTETGSDAA